MSTKKQPVVEVTGELIEKAVKSDAGFCMIAEAIKEAYPGVTNVLVDLQSIRFTDRKAGVRQIYLTPPHCQMQLLRFDQGVPIEPWAFRLPVRASQVTPVMSQKTQLGRRVPNSMGRPTSRGAREITEKASNYVPTVRGGKAPPLAVLAHTPGSGGGARKPRYRIFGLKLAGVFDGFVEAPNCRVAAAEAAQMGMELTGGSG